MCSSAFGFLVIKLVVFQIDVRKTQSHSTCSKYTDPGEELSLVVSGLRAAHNKNLLARSCDGSRVFHIHQNRILAWKMKAGGTVDSEAG